MSDEPTTKVTFTVTIEVTEVQSAAYAEAHGVGFAGLEIVNRARQAVANALDEAPFMRHASFKVGPVPGQIGAKPTRNWYDDWEVVDRDSDGNAILKHRPTEGLYRIVPVEET